EPIRPLVAVRPRPPRLDVEDLDLAVGARHATGDAQSGVGLAAARRTIELDQEMRAGALGRGDVEDAHHGLRSGCRKEPLGPMPRIWLTERLGSALTGVSAILQLEHRPGRQPDTERAVMVLTGFAVAGPVIRGGRDGEALTRFAIGNAAPGQRIAIEADDTDQIGRVLLDDDKPVFLRGFPEHSCGTVEIPGGAGVKAEAVGLVASAPRI